MRGTTVAPERATVPAALLLEDLSDRPEPAGADARCARPAPAGCRGGRARPDRDTLEATAAGTRARQREVLQGGAASSNGETWQTWT